jgi:hypothetical protein
VRLEDGGFLITPTDACLGRLEPQRLARLDANGRQLCGDRGSKTIALHRAIYAATLAAGHPARWVLHTHSTHAVALTLRGHPRADEPELLPALTPYFVMKVGRVPLLPYHRPGDPAVAQRVAERIAAGPTSGTTIQQAPRRCWKNWRKQRGWRCSPEMGQCRSKRGTSRNCAIPSTRSGSRPCVEYPSVLHQPYHHPSCPRAYAGMQRQPPALTPSANVNCLL